jgi:hypothetical protein
VAATPCDRDGNILPPGASPPPPEQKSPTDFQPWDNRLQFELSELIFTDAEMSGRNVDRLFDLWAADVLRHGAKPPFSDHRDLNELIDSVKKGDIPWKRFNVSYNGEQPAQNVPTWMDKTHEVWYRDPRAVVEKLLENTEFKDSFDYAPYQEFVNGKRRWSDFMSANWAWKQSVRVRI